MDIIFSDPSEIQFPPDEVRIRDLQVQPWQDGHRVSVKIETDPFQERPNIDLVIQDQEGNVVSTANIIESMTGKMEITMHIRENLRVGAFTLQATLYYDDLKDLIDRDEYFQTLSRSIKDTSEIKFNLT